MATKLPSSLSSSQQFVLSSNSQSVLVTWTMLPTTVTNRDLAPERVAASLRGMKNASELGLTLAEFDPMPKGSEFFAYRVEVSGRDENGRATPKTTARWRTDLSGVVFDFWVENRNTRGSAIIPGQNAPVYYDRPRSTHAASIFFNPTGRSVVVTPSLANRARLVLGALLDKIASLLSWHARWARRCTQLAAKLMATTIVPGRTDFKNASTLALPVHLDAGAKLTVRGRFPPGWRASCTWQIGFALVGLRKEPLE